MNTVKVKKAELSTIVAEKRRGHTKIVKEAIEGYRKQAMKLLEDHIERLKKGRHQIVQIYLTEPQDHTKDYDRVLKMIEMHIGPTIEISQTDFAKYVMDDWEWKQQFLSSNSTYSATAAAAMGSEDIED